MDGSNSAHVNEWSATIAMFTNERCRVLERVELNCCCIVLSLSVEVENAFELLQIVGACTRRWRAVSFLDDLTFSKLGIYLLYFPGCSL